MPKKGKKLDESKLQQHMEAYSEATAGALLDDAFGKLERSAENSLPYLDRADHIIIGGRTVTELLTERFNRIFPTLKLDDGRPVGEEHRKGKYGKFRSEEGGKLISQLVSGAIANGEKVEVFVPDRNTGRIGENPMTLTAKGYELAGPLTKPRQLSGWQKFWNKFGFYKKEKAAVVSYERETAARQKVRFCNAVARVNLSTNFALGAAYLDEMDRFHPEIREDMAKRFPKAGGKPAKMGQSNGFKTARSSFHAIVMGYMATRRDGSGKLLYTSEQMFDMADPVMQKARADAVREVYDRYKAGDTDWLVDMQHDAADVLRDRINDQAGKLDFTRPALTEQQGYREFALLCDVAFDQSQDMIATKVRMDEKYGKGAYWDAAGKLGECTQVYRCITQSMNVQMNLVNDLQGREESLVCKGIADVMHAQALQQQIGKAMKEHPDRKFSDVATVDLLMNARNVFNHADYDDMAVQAHRVQGDELPALLGQSLGLTGEQVRDPEKFGRQITGGVFERRIRLQELSDDPETPSRFEIRSAAAVEREVEQTRTAPAL